MDAKYFILDQNLAIKVFHDILVKVSEENELENIHIENFYNNYFNVTYFYIKKCREILYDNKKKKLY